MYIFTKPAHIKSILCNHAVMNHIILMLLSVVLIYFLLHLPYPSFLSFLCSYNGLPLSLYVIFVCNKGKTAVPGAFPRKRKLSSIVWVQYIMRKKDWSSHFMTCHQKIRWLEKYSFVLVVTSRKANDRELFLPSCSLMHSQVTWNRVSAFEAWSRINYLLVIGI